MLNRLKLYRLINLLIFNNCSHTYVTFSNRRMALDDTLKVYEELRIDLDTTYLVVTRGVLASLVESETITRSVEDKCHQMLQKKVDAVTRKVNAELRSRTEKLQKQLAQKSKVN